MIPVTTMVKSEYDRLDVRVGYTSFRQLFTHNLFTYLLTYSSGGRNDSVLLNLNIQT